MANPHYERVLSELSSVLGFTDNHALASGGRIKAGDHIITFIHDEIDAHHLSVYVDLGKPSKHENARSSCRRRSTSNSKRAGAARSRCTRRRGTRSTRSAIR